jgi:predicted nucleic acid-binding protein
MPVKTAVISFAINNQGYLAMIDDAAASNCSISFGIPTLGTAGLLLLAKKRGIIETVSTPLQAIRDSVLFFSDTLIAPLLKTAGEEAKRRKTYHT